MAPRILVAGIGNIFLGDDGFGCEVIRHLGHRIDVAVVDYGIRGTHLAYDLLDGWDALVLVDALPNRGVPGQLRVFEADHETLPTAGGFDTHSMDPGAVVATVRALGGSLPRTVVVGCQVGSLGEGIGLTAPVRDAVAQAAVTVTSVVEMLCEELASTENP